MRVVVVMLLLGQLLCFSTFRGCGLVRGTSSGDDEVDFVWHVKAVWLQDVQALNTAGVKTWTALRHFLFSIQASKSDNRRLKFKYVRQSN